MDSRGIRLALAGGGTGGHIVPGLHLLRGLKRRELQSGPRASRVARVSHLLWFHTGRRVEEGILDSLQQEISPSPVERVALSLEPRGGGAPSLARLSWRTAPCVFAARRALRSAGSQVLLGLGGYTSLPAVLAARSLGIPVVLFEINAVPGRATRWLDPLAQRVLHAWRPTIPAGESPRHVLTGPPLAPEFFELASSRTSDHGSRAREELGFEGQRPLLLVLGGSQGARSLNRFVRESLSPLLSREGLQVLHQTGPGRSAEGAEERSGYRRVEFLANVPRALRAATLVLSRGGASTVAEIAAAERPAWIVPYPHHGDRHQAANAGELGEGCRIVPESRLGPELAEELSGAVGEAGAAERRAMSQALRGRVPADADLKLFDELLAVANPGAAAE